MCVFHKCISVWGKWPGRPPELTHRHIATRSPSYCVSSHLRACTSCRFFSVVGTFKVRSLRITQEQDTVLSAIIAKLPIRSPERIYLSTGSVCPRPAAPHFLPTPFPGTALYSLFLCHVFRFHSSVLGQVLILASMYT